VTHLERTNAVFARSTGLFRLVATMRIEHFHAFRDYTQGTSAIQSEAYKRFELACGRPTGERLESDAFTSVPAVRAHAATRPDDLSQAYLHARRDARFSRDEFEAIDEALVPLETAHQRWEDDASLAGEQDARRRHRVRLHQRRPLSEEVPGEQAVLPDRRVPPRLSSR
jgi:tryptophan 2,3-dioxygenase